MKIRDYIDVVSQPTVVRLDQLRSEDPAWISDSYYITAGSAKYLKAIRTVLSRDQGSGIFLIGHYGSGKSHFLAYLAQQLRSGAFIPGAPAVAPISLLNYQAVLPLESIVLEALGKSSGSGDRRKTWRQILDGQAAGLLLIVDELSEFLRSKPTLQSFNEDLRFLQFLGEWAQDHRLWILAALQEQIEHTGDMEYDLYRKIKDRYPLRFLLTPTHIKDLIAHRIMRKKPAYGPAIEKLAKELKELYPEGALDYAEFCEIYPLHPATMDLLEEVRDRFSQARGIVDFTLTQMLGDEARGIPPFLDKPWGQLITPDVIVDHFADLFEVQAEFLPIAQKLLPYFRRRVPELFDKKLQQELAWRLLKLLMLVHLSPNRKWLLADQAAQWLFLKVSIVDPEKNREIIRHVLDTLVQQGAFLKRYGSRYSLDLDDAGREDLDQLLARTVAEIRERGDALFESLLPCLEGAEFNPFALPRDRWHERRIRWHFHDRELQVCFGGAVPLEPKGPALQIGLPWGPPAEGLHCFRLLPRRMEVSPEILELAALVQLCERPLPERSLQKCRELVAGRSGAFRSMIRAAYADATVFDPAGAKVTPPHFALEKSGAWMNMLGEWILRQSFPAFERFAPGHGPVSKDCYRQFMEYASEHDLGDREAPEAVKLIREAYLVPMGLMQRRGPEYAVSPRLDHHELVRLLAPIIEHEPSPERLYRHLGAPPYGLVADQIHLMLLVLLIQGEIDIVKGGSSYRDAYETLINPLQYDKIIPGRALTLQQVHDLEILCEGFRIAVPRQWSVLSEKRAIAQLRRIGSRQRDQMSELLQKLKGEDDTEELQEQLQRLIAQWLSLEKGNNELQGFPHFLYETGSPQRFLLETGSVGALLDRVDYLVRESRRYRHLFGYPSVAQCADADIATAVQALQRPPSLAQPEDLQAWIDQAHSVYKKYLAWYRHRHEAWRGEIDSHPIWPYRIPAAARSRHVALAAAAKELEDILARARSQRCQGMASLDFQPLCRCGFDGAGAPLDGTLRAFEDLSRQLEHDMALFFQQEKVKSRVREWVDQKLELNTQTLSYLEGKTGYPTLENVTLFDQHLSGLDLVKPVKAEALLEIIGGRTWEKAALMRELDRFFERFGPRISLDREEPAPRQELVAWCCEQALKQGCPLPPGFSERERALIADALRPQWVGEAALENLAELDIGEPAVEKIVAMLLDGAVQPPRTRPSSGPVSAALELLAPVQPSAARELAVRIAALYEQNERMLRVRPAPWLARLNELAELSLAEPPRPLDKILRDHADAQWIVVDCIGVALQESLRAAAAGSFPRWLLCDPEYALSSQVSSTDSFYGSLIDGKIIKSFDKVNTIDALIHERRLSFDDLARLSRAEMEIAFRKLNPKLDPARPLLLFGDHGFRLSTDGRSFTHGAASTLERLTLVLPLSPL